MTTSRRLAAILAADVAGYSRLMGADEEGTLDRLKAHRRQLIDPKIGEHHGRIVKTTGDGLLAEFPSVVDAVRCAAEMQRGMLDREPQLPDDRRIRLRIGINLGDVIAEGDDIFGDGVNVAARLEGLAEPGGICVSGVVRDQIRGKLPYPLDDRGEQNVKNIAIQVRVYAMRPETIADLPAPGIPVAAPRRLTAGPAIIAAVAVAAVLIAAGGAWWLWPATKSSPKSAVAANTSIAQPLVAPRLSIVVLPLANLSNDPDQQYFADGITEDVTTDLSRIPDMFVISRNTAFTYRNRPIDTKAIGRELGVRYVLEGSVRRSADKIRVNAQLIDAEANAHVWAERFDRDAADLLSLQSEITSRVSVALHQEIVGVEATRSSQHPDALEYILRGRAAYFKPGRDDRDHNKEAAGLFERALELDPNSVEAQSWLAFALAWRVYDGTTESAVADVARAEGLVAQALAASPRSLLPHLANGVLWEAQQRCEEAVPEFETVISLDRNWWYAYALLGECKLKTGSIEESIPLYERAIRLSPRDAYLPDWYFGIGRVHLLQSETDEAILWFEKARNANPKFPTAHAWLASAYALNGESEEAATELIEARKLRRDNRYSSIAHLKAVGNWGVPKIRDLYEATFFAGLRKAGMPEE
jgi:TolB-like protein/class 3 adenylate cyclase/Tfp pilus assembly protein PilF